MELKKFETSSELEGALSRAHVGSTINFPSLIPALPMPVIATCLSAEAESWSFRIAFAGVTLGVLSFGRVNGHLVPTWEEK